MAVNPAELTTTGETMYEQLQSAVEEYGEVMIRFDSGVESELHRHNAEFTGAPTIKVTTPDAVYWFNAEKIESYWIHYDF